MKIDFTKFSGTGMTSDSSREKLISILKNEGIKNSKVLRSMQLIPRHIFVDEAISSKAYDNTALPIGKSQTISHPLIVAKMTEIIMAYEPKRVLEIGTGSGYQASILSLLVDKVYTIERIEYLHMKSKNIFRKSREITKDIQEVDPSYRDPLRDILPTIANIRRQLFRLDLNDEFPEIINPLDITLGTKILDTIQAPLIELGFLGQNNIANMANTEIPYDQLKTTDQKIDRINKVDSIVKG